MNKIFLAKGNCDSAQDLGWNAKYKWVTKEKGEMILEGIAIELEEKTAVMAGFFFKI